MDVCHFRDLKALQVRLSDIYFLSYFEKNSSYVSGAGVCIFVGFF